MPVFLLGDREKALAAMDRDLLELVDAGRLWIWQKIPPTLSPDVLSPR
ncbi:hypothetical protein ACLB1M_00725 [Escherichia coli]